MRFSVIILSLNLLSFCRGFPMEQGNGCELLEHVDTDDSWSNIFDNVRRSLEDAIKRASNLEKCNSQVEFLQSCLDRANRVTSPKEQMQYVVEFIGYQEMHSKNEPTRTNTYFGKNMIHLFKKTVDKLTQLSRKLIKVSEKIDERLGKTIDKSRKLLFGQET
ncbi:uncharacterized protein LOC27207329 [Drosophila simulans]|uniref:Secreted protein n=1 Tax=Drosophila simulans TaxID=7240 RepID=A0A0J9QXY2_DROSI|nr:uncharacterized protein LOC27207329 [Drosophila simulans]KMY88942.1 uncharacterized protein Dsimw501_GD27480 [Drosophila simulans]